MAVKVKYIFFNAKSLQHAKIKNGVYFLDVDFSTFGHLT